MKVPRLSIDQISVINSILDQVQKHPQYNKSIEDAVEQLKQANGGSDVDTIKAAIEKLNKAWEPVAQKMYQAAQQEAQTSQNGANVNADQAESNGATSKKDGEVEDADFEVVEDEK